MKYFLTTLIISLCFLSFSQEVLDNTSVIELIKSGLPKSIVIKKIKESPNRYDLSTEALVALTKKEVPEDIIAAMMEAEENRVSENYEMISNFSEPGIYLVIGPDIEKDIMHMQPSVIDKVKYGSTGNTIAKTFTSAAKTKVRATVSSPTSNTQTGSRQPQFFFNFYTDESVASSTPDVDKNDPAAMIQALQSMSQQQRISISDVQSPNEMKLVRCDVKKKGREFIASSSSGMAMETGFDSEYLVPFKYEKMATGLFRIYFDSALEPGEYLFIYTGVQVYQGQMVYDFSVTD